MDTEKRIALEERRRQLQLKQQVAAFAASDLQPYLEIVDYLSKHDVPYRMVHVAHVQADWLPSMREIMRQAPYLDYGFPMDRLCTDDRIDLFGELFQRYPSTNSFRYVPDLPRFADYGTGSSEGLTRDGLRKAITALALQDQQVYLYYLRYAPVIELSLFDLMAHDHPDLFNLGHGDALIFPANLDWVIAFTLEEEWYGGRE